MSCEQPEIDPHELSVTTFIDAAPDKVWSVMIDRMEEWWCPTPWRANVDEVDWRPGGISRITMYGPDGEVVPNEGLVLDFVPGQRFAFTDAIKGGLMPQGPFMIGIFEIAPEGTGTRYTACSRHWTKEAMEQHRDMGFEQGWGDRKSTRLNSSHTDISRMPSSA